MPWGAAEELAATGVELQHATIRVLLTAFGAKQIPDVLEIPRPGGRSTPPTRREATVDEMVDMLGPMLTVGGRGVEG